MVLKFKDLKNLVVELDEIVDDDCPIADLDLVVGFCLDEPKDFTELNNKYSVKIEVDEYDLVIQLVG